MATDRFKFIGETRGRAHAEAAAILIDSKGDPTSPTRNALRILLYPEAQQGPVNRKARRLALERIGALFPAGLLAPETEPVGQFISGRRRYVYRVYRFADTRGNPQEPAAIIVLERDRQPLTATPDSLAQYRLTTREEQVTHYVLQGFSNKRIADTMGISPNTVKVFLRLVMTKMGVTNRYGIVSKVLGRDRRHFPSEQRKPVAIASAAGVSAASHL